MGCCNEPATALALATPDPSQHVNYAKGMVLGVDDFTQEFAYLIGRDHWLAREAIGYGTLTGLRVYTETDADGPRLHVNAGTALLPSGRLACVPADQCALLNKWLAKKENAATVSQLLSPASPPLSPSSPPMSPPLSPPAVTSGIVSLYLTLGYADCRTRPVPIPGEPCRSDDELMAPSRVADDFRLELRGTAPVQAEEDSLRDFVRWIRDNVQVVETGGADPSTWLETLRPAAGAWIEQSSPPASFGTLGDYLFDLSPGGLEIDAAQLCDFLRVALRFWVTELRPVWIAARCGRPVGADDDRLLLARVDVEVEWIDGSPTGAWQVASGADTVTIDETTRPFLGHLRLLQEWLLCGKHEAAAAAVTSPSVVSPSDPSPPPPTPAPDDAAYVVAAADASLTNAQSLGALTTGLLLNTVAAGTGTLSTAVEGTNYYAPGGTDVAVADGGTGTSTPPADGQVLIGSAGSYVPASIAGTPNQIAVTQAAGSVTIAAPQDLAATSSPQFAGLTTKGQRTVAVSVVGTPAMVLTANHHVVVCTGAAGTTLQLPAANTNVGRVFVIKNAKSGLANVTVKAAVGDDIQGAPAELVAVSRAVTVISGGGNRWYVIGRA